MGNIFHDDLRDLKGLEFPGTYQQSTFIEIEGLEIRLIGYRDLIRAKKASGRAKDWNDIENLGDNTEKQ